MSTPDIRVKISPEGIDEIIKGMQRISAQSKTTGNSVLKAFGGLQNLIPAIGFTAITAGMVAIGKSALNAADQIGKLQQKVGGTTEDLSALSFAANMSNVSNEELAKSLVRLNRSLGELLAGSEAQTTAFADLGLAGRDLVGLDVNQSFEKIARAAAGMGAGLDRTNALIAIFGKDAAKLIPLLNDVGTKGFAAVRAEAERLGLIVSTELADAAASMNDNFTLMQKRSEGLALQFLTGLVPAIQKTFNEFNEAVTDKGVHSMQRFGEVTGKVLEFIINLVSVFTNIIGRSVITVTDVITGLGASLVALFSGNVKGAIQVANDASTKFFENLQHVGFGAVDDVIKIFTDLAKEPPKLAIKPVVTNKTTQDIKDQLGLAGKAARDALAILNKQIGDDTDKSLKAQSDLRRKFIEDQIQQQRALLEARTTGGPDQVGAAQRLAQLERAQTDARIRAARDAFTVEIALAQAKENALRALAQKNLGDTKNNERVQAEITRQSSKQRLDISVAYYGDLVKLQQQFTNQYKQSQQAIADIDKEIRDNRKEGEDLFAGLRLSQFTEQQQFGIKIRTANEKLDELQSAVLRGNLDRAREIRKEITGLAGEIAKSTKIDPNAILIGERIFGEANAAVEELLNKKREAEVAQATSAQKGIEAVTAQISKLQESITKLQTDASSLKVGIDDASLQSTIDKIKKALTDTPFQIAIAAQINGPGNTTVQAFAGGGIAPGIAPNPRADNILARITSGEAITQVPAVKYYGTKFMDDINKMRLPRFAEGGIVGGGNTADAENMGTLELMVGGRNIGKVQGTRETLRDLGHAIQSAARGT